MHTRTQILFSFALAVCLAAILAGRHTATVKQLSAPAGTPAPLPTEINQNFLAQIDRCFLPLAFLNGYTLRVSSGFRTVEEQQALYEQGRTVDGHIVTEAPGGRSIHNFGYAVDVVDRFRGFAINWDRLRRIGEYCGLEYSEDGDEPHFERRAGLTTDQFVAGMRPPLLALPPCRALTDRTASSTALTPQDLAECDIPKF